MTEINKSISPKLGFGRLKWIVVYLVVIITANVLVSWLWKVNLSDISLRESLYWVFSASAQGIAAFIAFIVAGYVFFDDRLNSYEKETEEDDDYYLIPIKRKYYFGYLKFLCILTGVCIALNLFMLFINSVDFILKKSFMILAIESSGSTILFAIIFIIKVLNPDSSKIIAEKKLAVGYEDSLKTQALGEFTEKFIKLESLLFRIVGNLERKPSPKGNSNYITYSAMVKALLYNEMINYELFQKLNKVGEYRNLVLHGKKEFVSDDMMQMLNEVYDKVIKSIDD